MNRFPRTRRLSLSLILLLGTAVLAGCAQEQGSTTSEESADTAQVDVDAPSILSDSIELESDVPFVESPQPVVDRMLEVANVGEDDVVYDLGSGDGRIPITAARDYGARGVGIEIKPDLVRRARENARDAGVNDRVEFREGDLFEADISEATVVTLYLLPSVNLELRPKLFRQLEPGTRIVSHDFDMDEWEPDTTVESSEGDTIYRWVIPEEIPSFVDTSSSQ